MATSQRAKSGSSQRFELPGPDLEIVASLSVRYLSIERIKWLHFPVWRERYAHGETRRGAVPWRVQVEMTGHALLS